MARIKVLPGGPYRVENATKLVVQHIASNDLGQSWEYKAGRSIDIKDVAYLCRCGRSANKPFCDGSHKSAGVDLTETAGHAPLVSSAKEIDGPELILTDNERYCAFARFCDAGEKVWNEVQMPGEQHARMTEHMTHRCPGGRLQVWAVDGRGPIEPRREQSINLIEDPAQECSAGIMLLGEIEVVDAGGVGYEIRARQALCRCGASSNKPFCDGSHASIKFQDGLP